jgi:hypothetical protein
MFVLSPEVRKRALEVDGPLLIQVVGKVVLRICRIMTKPGRKFGAGRTSFNSGLYPV